MKHWYESKTLWLNAALAAVGIFLDAAPEGVEWVAVANMVLRYFTSKSIGL